MSLYTVVFDRVEMKGDGYILAICGSRADDSNTRKSLRRVLEAAEAEGARTELVDLREYDLPTFDADERDAGDAERLRKRIRRADGVVLGTPMYHGSYSSTLKTALDYCRIEDFEGTTVGLLAVAGGGFPTTALNHLRAVCRALKAWTIPHQVVVPNAHARFEAGRFSDDDLEKRVAELGREVFRYAGVEEYPSAERGQIEATAGD